MWNPFKKKPKYKYPLRMKSRHTGAVVEFYSLEEGMCIKSGRSDMFKGYKSKWFIEHTDTESWEPYNPIWLEQKK